VCLDAQGRPSFERLRRRLRTTGDAVRAGVPRSPATLTVFDVLHLDGRAVRTLPYARRRELLEEVLRDGQAWRVPRAFPADRTLIDATRAHELEGVVAKKLDAPYREGCRSGAWLKHKHLRRETFAITGWRERTAQRPELITLARMTPRGPEYVGGASYGLSGTARTALREQLERLALDSRPGRRFRRVRAGLVADVDFHGPGEGPVRDPIIRAVRETD
jgi:bifunctional non-homologous end joining protein LigD